MEPLFESLKLLPPTDTRLNSISREVSGTDFRRGRVDKIAGVMLEVAAGERDEDNPQRPSLVGLAAPQIGAFVRMILWDAKATAGEPNFNPDFRVLVNPRITRSSEEEELGREGCYSTGDIRAVVFRAKSVTISGLDLQNRAISRHITDPFQARIIQHEIDHLNGIRCPDRVRSPKHLHMASADQFQAYRENWDNWPHHIPVETWLKMKQGRS